MTLTDYITAHPGCDFGDVMDAFPIWDAADCWNHIHDPERDGAIVKDNSDGGRWHFYPAARR